MHTLVRESESGLMFWVDEYTRLVVGDQTSRDRREGHIYGPSYTVSGIQFVDASLFEAAIRDHSTQEAQVGVFDGGGALYRVPIISPSGHKSSIPCSLEELEWVVQYYRRCAHDKE